MSNITKPKTNTLQECTCLSCEGAACTCGCQTTRTERRTECKCGSKCKCGPDCNC